MGDIGSRIKEIRTLAKQTQLEFSKHLGIDRGHISRLENSTAVPSDSLVKLISHEYNINEKWLLFGEGVRDSHKEEYNHTSPPDMALLTTIIELIEEAIQQGGLPVTPQKKTEVIGLIYEYYSVKGGFTKGDTEGIKHTVLKYLSLLNHADAGDKPVNKSGSNVINITGKGNVGNVSVKGNVGNGNKGHIQFGGNVTIKNKTSKVHYLPPTNSIGNNPYLKQTITGLFNKIGEEREKRFGQQAYAVMYSKFKKDFGIKNQAWTVIWTWPEECAQEIIEYLNGKYNNTIQGKTENAWKGGKGLPKRPWLYQREGELLAHLGLKTSSPEVKELLYNFFGVSSHKHISNLQHWQLVKYLESQVDKIDSDPV